VPYLGRGGVDGKDDWRAVPLAPSGAPDALTRALSDGDLEALVEYGRRSPVGVVLVADPLEEVVRAGGRCAALVDAIASGPAHPGLRLLGALGEEATPELFASPLGGAVRAALRYVGGPATAAVTDIVAAPARFAGVTVLGADMVAADVRRELRAGGVGRLPFVSLALTEWWRASGGAAPQIALLHGDRWKETGGVGGAVVRHAERVVAALDTEDRALAEELLLRLSATDGAGLRWDEDELCAVVAEERERGPGREREAAVRAVLARLERELLVRVEGGSVEIGHEALLRDWPRLTSARLAQMDRLLLVERLRDARLAWKRADGHRDFLLHGALLEEARGRAKSDRRLRGLGPKDRAFLQESRRRARFRGVRRAALASFIAISVAGSVRGKRMLDHAREEEAKAKAAAVELEQLTELAAKARRTEDPYHRATLVSAALARGSTDGMLPLDLLATAANLARAEFLTLDRVDAPSFPWNDRFLIGSFSAGTLAVLDFKPPESDAAEDVEPDVDPSAEPEPVRHRRPALARLRPHDAPVVERADFAFDTAFATRASSGEVKVFRVREDGRPALAAVAPLRCIGPMRVAAAAPVLACATDRGVARWDMRRKTTEEAVVVHPFKGDVSDVSPDGERVAALGGAEVLFWCPSAGTEVEYTAPRPPALVRLAPHAPAAALLESGQVEIVDERRPSPPRFVFSPEESRAVRMRWDDGGVDLAICEAGGGRWYYLRHGGRSWDDPPPRDPPCAPRRTRSQPEPVASPDEAPELADRDVGSHLPAGGWKLRGHRYLTRDLVILDAAAGRSPTTVPRVLPPAAARLLHVEGHDDIGGDEPVAEGDSVVAVGRDETAVMFQVGDEMRFYALPEGTRLFARKGNFLRRCADGRWLAWEAAGDTYRVFDAWLGGSVRSVPREPGFVLGVGGACRALYTQRLDGTLVDHPFDGRPAHEMGRADGYVYDARPSASQGAPHGGSGIFLSFSSGAVARIDDATRAVRVLGYASPRALAVADGPHPGEVVLADAAGVFLLRPGARPSLLREGDEPIEWSDLSVSPDGASLLLASADRVAALDITRRELLGSIPVAGKERLARWDDEGSVLLWSFDRKGGPEGLVVPRGVPLARRVAQAVCNLEVAKGRVAIKR
jgi:hypothetical protein